MSAMQEIGWVLSILGVCITYAGTLFLPVLLKSRGGNRSSAIISAFASSIVGWAVMALAAVGLESGQEWFVMRAAIVGWGFAFIFGLILAWLVPKSGQ